MKPTLGRIVIYRDGDDKHPGIVIHVHSETMVNLVCWDKDGGQHFRSMVLFASTHDEQQYRWSWPPREG